MVWHGWTLITSLFTSGIGLHPLEALEFHVPRLDSNGELDTLDVTSSLWAVVRDCQPVMMYRDDIMNCSLPSQSSLLRDISSEMKQSRLVVIFTRRSS